jgi:hypothetical protein
MQEVQFSQNNHPLHLASASLRLSRSVANLNVQLHTESLSFWGQGTPCRGPKRKPENHCFTVSHTHVPQKARISWPTEQGRVSRHSPPQKVGYVTWDCYLYWDRALYIWDSKVGVGDTRPRTSAPYHSFHPIRDRKWNTKRSAAGPHFPVIVKENV